VEYVNDVRPASPVRSGTKSGHPSRERPGHRCHDHVMRALKGQVTPGLFSMTWNTTARSAAIERVGKKERSWSPGRLPDDSTISPQCPRSEPDERDDTSRACSCRWKPRTASRHEREATLNDGGGRDHCKNPKRPRPGSVDEGFHSERGPMARAGRRRDSVRGGRPDGARARRRPHAHERRRHSAAEILRARAVVPLHFEG
jgi:hypothetical protein